MESLAYVGPGSIRGWFHGTGPYPGATFDENGPREISGEIYSLPESNEETLRRLDRYEEYFPEAVERSLFVREERLVRGHDGKRTKCWVYSQNLNLRN